MNAALACAGSPPGRSGLDAAERSDARALRHAIRAGRHRDHTVGLAPGRVQGNLVILPRALADDFLRFCQRNPRPCPVLAVTEPGARPSVSRRLKKNTKASRVRQEGPSS